MWGLLNSTGFFALDTIKCAKIQKILHRIGYPDVRDFDKSIAKMYSFAPLRQFIDAL